MIFIADYSDGFFLYSIANVLEIHEFGLFLLCNQRLKPEDPSFTILNESFMELDPDFILSQSRLLSLQFKNY